MWFAGVKLFQDTFLQQTTELERELFGRSNNPALKIEDKYIFGSNRHLLRVDQICWRHIFYFHVPILNLAKNENRKVFFAALLLVYSKTWRRRKVKPKIFIIVWMRSRAFFFGFNNIMEFQPFDCPVIIFIWI